MMPWTVRRSTIAAHRSSSVKVLKPGAQTVYLTKTADEILKTLADYVAKINPCSQPSKE